MSSIPRPVLLYIVKHSFIGGSALHVLQLLRHFSARYDVQLCVGEWGYLAEAAQLEGFSVRHLPALGGRPSPGKLFSMRKAMHQLLTEVKPDLVHLHAPLAGVIGRLVCHARRVPCILTVHGWNFVPGPGWRRRLSSWVLEIYAAHRAPAQVITVSEYDALMARRYLFMSASCLKVVHNGIPEVPSAAKARPQDSSSLIMVARFASQKDPETLLWALTSLPGRDWRLRFVGEGETMPESLALAESLGLGEQVEFMGARNDVESLLAESGIFVLTSRYEGLPLAVIEAMRAQLPVLASRVGGMAELVVDGETGYLHDPGDQTVLAGHLDRLLSDPALRQRMGQAGRRRFEMYFSEQAMFDQTTRIYDELLSQPRDIESI